MAATFTLAGKIRLPGRGMRPQRLKPQSKRGWYRSAEALRQAKAPSKSKAKMEFFRRLPVPCPRNSWHNYQGHDHALEAHGCKQDT
jgi:hypothetical protein